MIWIISKPITDIGRSRRKYAVAIYVVPIDGFGMIINDLVSDVVPDSYVA